MTPISNECIGFIFREILSQLIETTLLLDKEQTQRNYYLNLTLQPHQQPKGATVSFSSIGDKNTFHAITPAELAETCRRCLLKKNSNVINKFQKCSEIKTKKDRLLFF